MPSSRLKLQRNSPAVRKSPKRYIQGQLHTVPIGNASSSVQILEGKKPAPLSQWSLNNRVSDKNKKTASKKRRETASKEKGKTSKKKKKGWKPPMFRKSSKPSFLGQNTPLITSANSSRQQQRPMPGVASIPASVRLQMLQYGNEQHHSIENAEAVPGNDDNDNLAESCEEEYYNKLFGTNESESSLDLYQDSISSAGSPDTSAIIRNDSKRSIGRPRNSNERIQRKAALSRSILKYKQKRSLSAVSTSGERVAQQHDSTAQALGMKSGLQKKAFVFVDEDDDDDFDESSLLGSENGRRKEQFSVDRWRNGGSMNSLMKTNRNTTYGPFVLCRPVMKECPRPSFHPTGYSWANNHESKYSRMKRSLHGFWGQQHALGNNESTATSLHHHDQPIQGSQEPPIASSNAKKTPSEEIQTDVCTRETRQMRRRAALNADLQCAVDAGIMTIEEAFKFNDTNISNHVENNSPKHEKYEDSMSSSRSNKRRPSAQEENIERTNLHPEKSDGANLTTGTEKCHRRVSIAPEKPCRTTNIEADRTNVPDARVQPYPVKRSARIKKPRRLTKDLKDMVDNDYISEKEAWAMMVDDIGKLSENTVEEISEREEQGRRGDDEAGTSSLRNCDGQQSNAHAPEDNRREPDLALGDNTDDGIDCPQDNNLHKSAISVLDESVAEPRPPVNYQTTIDLVSDLENDDDDSDSGWENPPPINLDDDDAIGTFNDDEVLLPRHSEFLPYLRTIEDVENGARKLAQCVNGTCSVCANTQKRQYAEDIVQIENLRAQFSSNTSGRRRAPTYKHLNKKKKTTAKKRKRSTTRGKGGKRQKAKSTSKRSTSKRAKRSNSVTKPASTRIARANSRGSKMVNALNSLASSRRFNDSHLFGGNSPRGARFVRGSGEAFDVCSDVYGAGGLYDANPENAGSGEISWEGQGTIGLDGI